MDHSTMNYQWKKLQWKKLEDQYLEGEVIKHGNLVVEVVAFKEYGQTYVVYMYKDSKYLGSRGYDGEKLAKEMAIEFLETGKEL